MVKIFGHLCNIQHFKIIIAIMTENIIVGHNGFLGISFIFWNTSIPNLCPYKYKIRRFSIFHLRVHPT